MAERVTEFLISGNAGWELTAEEFKDCQDRVEIFHDADVILVQWGSKYFILNRDFINVKVREDNGNGEDNRVEEILAGLVGGDTNQ